MEQALPLGDLEENVMPKRNFAPTFKPYDNKQAQMILDLEMYIPSHHVAGSYATARLPYLERIPRRANESVHGRIV